MKKSIFIHIPKAAGSSIGNLIRKHNPDLSLCLHRKVSFYPKETRGSCFVFSFVRNPYDRLLSAHKYLTGDFGNDGDKEYGKNLSKDFSFFVKNQLESNLGWLHFKPMSSWLDLEIDFVGKFENIQQDFDIVCKKIGISPQQLPHDNKTKHQHYSKYYNKDTCEIVGEIYKQDLELYNYSFVRG